MILSPKIKDLLLISLIFFSSNFLLATDCYKAGADRPELYLKLLQNKVVAVVTNQTGLLENKTHLVDFLLENKINIKTIFAPEHGFRGHADAGELVKNGVDTKTQIPIISLYGNNKKPSPDHLKGIDVVLFDIQDVGVRFYTYISTLTFVMEAVAELNKEIIVLDRPNPHDGYIDGPILQKKWISFVGLHPIPVVYGLTIGEYGKMVNGEKWLKNGIQARYTLIPMLGYHKKMRYPISEKPSPNLPNSQSILLYPSLCFFEGTQVSVGRGTPFPFQVYGSPWIKKSYFQFTPKPSVGAKDPFLNGQICYGENLENDKSIDQKLNLDWLLKAYREYKNPKLSFFLDNLFFDKLAGSDLLRKQIIDGKTEQEIRKSWEVDLYQFQKVREKYIIYPD